MPPFIIDDRTPSSITHDPRHGRGGEPRDYAVDPPEMFASPTEMQLIPQSEWAARIAEQEATKSSLEHIRMIGNSGQMIPSLDQGSWGYCWAHSTTHTVMLARARANDRYIALSAFAVAATIKKGQNEGGWCGLSAQFIRDKGVPSQDVWPQGDANYRAHDTPQTWEDAAKHKITEDWVDLSQPVYDQNLTFNQVATCLLMNIPVALDYYWWGHSVCGIRLVQVGSGEFGVKIWNSWGDGWGDQGMSVITGGRMYPNGAVATRVITGG